MAGERVTPLLVEYEQRLRDLGAPVVEYLRPGLGEQEMDEISAEFGVRLTPEARAWWGWHDGHRERVFDDWDGPRLVPYGTFCGLRGALEHSRFFRTVMTDALGPEAEDDRPRPQQHDRMFSRHHLMLLHDQRSLVMDCRDAGEPVAPVGYYTTHRGFEWVTTLAEQIGWWIWALDQRYWVLRPDGSWRCDPDRAPGTLVGRHVRGRL